MSELVLPTLLATLAVLMMLVGNTLYQLLEQMIQQKWPALYVMRVLVLNIPTVLVITLPVAAALAASLTTGRIARDNEMTVLRGAGVGIRRAALPVAIFGVLLSVLDLYVAEKIVPWAWGAQQNAEALLANLPSSPIDSSLTLQVQNYTITFQSARRRGPGIYELSRATLLDQGVDSGEFPRVLTAERARYSQGIWSLDDVRLHLFQKDGATLFDGRARTGTLSLQLDMSRSYLFLRGEQLGNLSFSELTRRARDAHRSGDRGRAQEFEVNRWFKLGLPVLCLPFALAGVALGLRFSGAGSFAGVLLALVVVFVGANLLFLAKFLALTGRLPAVVAAIAPAGLLTLAALAGLKAQE